MSSSQNSSRNNVPLAIYSDNRTVFRLRDVALLVGESDFQSINKKLNYYVRTGKLHHPRKGIYTKKEFDPEELACKIYIPSYISCEYVLQKSGIVFQYDPTITVVSYLSRSIEVSEQAYRFRKIKDEILVNTAGIIRKDNHVNIASPERAFLDVMYLHSDYFFDNLNPLNKQTIIRLAPIYQSDRLIERVKSLMQS